MPQLTVAHGRVQAVAVAVAGRGEAVSRDREWMEEANLGGDGEGRPAERSGTPRSSNPPPADAQQGPTLWSRALRTLTRAGWCSFAPLGAVWLACQVEALPHPSSSQLPAACCRLLLLCLLWAAVGGCVHALKCCLWPGRDQGRQQEAVAENRSIHNSWTSPSRSPDLHVPLALALADSLLLCVLQEPLPDPSLPHIQALLSRLESVSHTLETGSEDTSEEEEEEEEEEDRGGSALLHRVNLICTYLQQRTGSLRALLQVQGDFEAGVKAMLEGLGGLWAQLEELHTGVTLTKEGGRSHGDLALARADAESLFAVLGHYRTRLRLCETQLKASTQLLQELSWSHTHARGSSSSSESVWPELLLQSNIEQFDKAQEGFLSLEQQTSTFQAHLEGLGKENQEVGSRSCSGSPRTSPRLPSAPEHRGSTSTASVSASSDADSDAEAVSTPLSLCERSALRFSSTVGRLRKSGRRK